MPKGLDRVHGICLITVRRTLLRTSRFVPSISRSSIPTAKKHPPPHPLSPCHPYAELAPPITSSPSYYWFQRAAVISSKKLPYILERALAWRAQRSTDPNLFLPLTELVDQFARAKSTASRPSYRGLKKKKVKENPSMIRGRIPSCLVAVYTE